ncbi:hypothetical protein ABZ543_34745 [Streptomyces roseifaciens]
MLAWAEILAHGLEQALLAGAELFSTRFAPGIVPPGSGGDFVAVRQQGRQCRLSALAHLAAGRQLHPVPPGVDLVLADGRPRQCLALGYASWPAASGEYLLARPEQGGEELCVENCRRRVNRDPPSTVGN